MEALTVMHKAGASIAVHPTCIAAHQRAGWAVSAVQPQPEPEPAPEPKPKRKKQDTPHE